MSTLQRQSWLVLSLRWLLGGIAGFGISWLVYLGISLGYVHIGVFAVPFIGQAFLFDPSFSGQNMIAPALIWGVIVALLVSGRKNQTTIGKVLLLLYIALGFILFYQMIRMTPT